MGNKNHKVVSAGVATALLTVGGLPAAVSLPGAALVHTPQPVHPAVALTQAPTDNATGTPNNVNAGMEEVQAPPSFAPAQPAAAQTGEQPVADVTPNAQATPEKNTPAANNATPSLKQLSRQRLPPPRR